MIGLGVMTNKLFGSKEAIESFSKAIGLVIARIELKGDALEIAFDGGYKIEIYDGGQLCCEHRYMSTDDDLEYYVGAKLLGAEIKGANNLQGEDSDVHEIEFLDIKTDRGVFTMVNHNEHNGYYGGFHVLVRGC